ncbi:MAG: magnesium transporter CorA [Lachnospiraceae bacterium]|nr:magnesium transporter CorA [Lachnospiraceae bacterium]
MYYKIEETLKSCDVDEALNGKHKYVAVLTPAEWMKSKERFDMGIDLPMELSAIAETKIDVNYDSLTGSFYIPNRANISEDFHAFAFAMDEKGIVLIDEDPFAEELVKKVAAAKKWRKPCLERFIYDFLEVIVSEDMKVLSGFDKKLNSIEDELEQNDNDSELLIALNDIRGEMLDLKNHYEQLIDVGQELEENENGFFTEENLRFFHLFTVRCERLRDNALALRDYTIQIRDLYQTQLDVKQNKIMALLTIITTVFFPLSIITGWYGMNFVHMPELAWKYSYPALALLCIVIVVIEIVWFKKKKYL